MVQNPPLQPYRHVGLRLPGGPCERRAPTQGRQLPLWFDKINHSLSLVNDNTDSHSFLDSALRPTVRCKTRRASSAPASPRRTTALSPDGGFTRSTARAAGTSPPRRKALSGRFCIILITALGQFRISVVLIADRGQFRTHFCHILYLILSLNHQAPTRTQIPGL